MPLVVQVQQIKPGELLLLHCERITAYGRAARVGHRDRSGSCAWAHSPSVKNRIVDSGK